MHVPPHLAMEDAEALAFAESRGFGLLTGHDGTKPVGSHLPFTLHHGEDGVRVQFHVARGNRLRDLADGRTVLLAVSGADAYVSNDWYATPDQVSTWLYEAVHLTGPLSRVEVALHRAHGDALLGTFEGRLAPKQPWTLDAMEARKRNAMLGAIVTLEMAVASVKWQRKLNQHKPDADHVAVVRALERAGGNAGPVAAAMRAMRPHLAYDDMPSDDGAFHTRAWDD